MDKSKDDPIVLLVSRIVSPFIMLFGLYVIFHGHYSPGGGFQGGAMLAAGILLVRLAAGMEIAQLQFKREIAMPLGALGVLIFLGTGLLVMFMGGRFLDYSYLPFPGMERAELHSLGILIIEVGVGLAVMAILVSIFDNLLEGSGND